MLKIDPDAAIFKYRAAMYYHQVGEPARIALAFDRNNATVAVLD